MKVYFDGAIQEIEFESVREAMIMISLIYIACPIGQTDHGHFRVIVRGAFDN